MADKSLLKMRQMMLIALQSHHDSEVVVAIIKLRALLKAEGIDAHDFLGLVDQKEAPPPPPPPPVPGTDSYFRKAVEILMTLDPAHMRWRDVEFIRNCNRRAFLTNKQKEWLDNCIYRYRINVV